MKWETQSIFFSLPLYLSSSLSLYFSPFYVSSDLSLSPLFIPSLSSFYLSSDIPLSVFLSRSLSLYFALPLSLSFFLSLPLSFFLSPSFSLFFDLSLCLAGFYAIKTFAGHLQCLCYLNSPIHEIILLDGFKLQATSHLSTLQWPIWFQREKSALLQKTVPTSNIQSLLLLIYIL